MTIQDKLIKVSGLLIAAGASRRLGQPKQLVKYKGNYLINHTIKELEDSKLYDLKVILGCKADSISSVIESDIDIIINKEWKSGMGTSIATGVNDLSNSIDGVFISLVDQYKMSANLIDQLINEFNQGSNKLIICRYGNDIYGPPAIFPRRLINNLKLLDGDQGAGKLIKSELSNYPDRVVVIDFEHGHLDVDTPEDLLNLSE